LAYAWEERVFKRTGSVFIRKFASINIRVLVEPTVQPITCKRLNTLHYVLMDSISPTDLWRSLSDFQPRGWKAPPWWIRATGSLRIAVCPSCCVSS